MRHESVWYTTPTTDEFLSAPRGDPPAGVSPEKVELLVAENAELVVRVQRLGPVLVGMAQDLSVARRESAALKRENRRLRSPVTTLEQRTAAALRASAGRTIRSPNPRSGLRSGRQPWQAGQPGLPRQPDSPPG
jgi:hypothetical protein